MVKKRTISSFLYTCVFIKSDVWDSSIKPVFSFFVFSPPIKIGPRLTNHISAMNRTSVMMNEAFHASITLILCFIALSQKKKGYVVTFSRNFGRYRPGPYRPFRTMQSATISSSAIGTKIVPFR